MSDLTIVRAHTRRKPSKPKAYIDKHAELRADVEAMRRGELKPLRKMGLLKWLWKAILHRDGWRQ